MKDNLNTPRNATGKIVKLPLKPSRARRGASNGAAQASNGHAAPNDPKAAALADATAKRLALFDMGYIPLPNHGKIPAIKGWNASDYYTREISPPKVKDDVAKRLLRWLRRFPDALTTGVRVENGLLVIDIDCDDQAMVEKLFAALQRIAPDVEARAPVRFGGGTWKLALFARLDGENFIRLRTRKYHRPGEPESLYHHVEAFGGKPFNSGQCSRQFAIHGPRSCAADGSVETEYQWAQDTPALFEVALADLPVLTKAQVLELLDVFETEAQAAGWIQLKEKDEGDGGGEDIFDIDREVTRFDVFHSEEKQITYAELEMLVMTRPEVRVSPEFMPGEVTTRPDRCTVFWSNRFDCAMVKDWSTYARHYPKELAPLDTAEFGVALKQWAEQHGRALPIKTPRWRELYKGTLFPKPSLENARRAITALGVVCSYNIFSDRILFGYRDDAQHRHVVAPLLGEVSDNGLKALRQLLSAAFGFDLTDQHVRAGVETLALERCFNPVADMLDAAEANWDGVKRLDRMAADYMSCEDTPLNAACMRKTMIAAVARVRNPGCKFDTISVLEGLQGWGKSTAWRILATRDEWFSDEKIIGKEGREVQEQLGGVWIHENAELAGMRKADIDTVTSFASRQVDRARPAYGHFLKRQPRHSIEVGTTNADTYLQSQVGNRRFWPKKLTKEIDLDKLTRDRMQLWGEAAHWLRQGESLVLDRSLWEAAGIEQEARRVKDAWEDTLAQLAGSSGQTVVVDGKVVPMFSYVSREGTQERIAAADLMNNVLKIPLALQSSDHRRRLANVMRQLQWQSPPRDNKITIKGRQLRGYFREIDGQPGAKAEITGS